jgi:2-methylcitrate dehydratase PrpD
LDNSGYDEGNPVEIEMQDGTVHSAWGKVRGGVDNPIPRADVVDKFRKLSARVLSPDAQERLITVCNRLERTEDARELLAPLTR